MLSRAFPQTDPSYHLIRSCCIKSPWRLWYWYYKDKKWRSAGCLTLQWKEKWSGNFYLDLIIFKKEPNVSGKRSWAAWEFKWKWALLAPGWCYSFTAGCVANILGLLLFSQHLARKVGKSWRSMEGGEAVSENGGKQEVLSWHWSSWTLLTAVQILWCLETKVSFRVSWGPAWGLELWDPVTWGLHNVFCH